MEGTLKTVGNLRMLTIVWQRTSKFVSPCFAALLLTNLTELGNARSHGSHIVECIANHIGDIGNLTNTGGFVERFSSHVAINKGTLHEELVSLVDHVIDLWQGIKDLCRSGTQLLKVGKTSPVHNLLCDSLSLLQCGVVGKELIHRGSRFSSLAILRRYIQTTATHDDGLVEQATSQRALAKCTDTAGTSTLAKDSHIIGVAAKLGNISLNPLQ